MVLERAPSSHRGGLATLRYFGGVGREQRHVGGSDRPTSQEGRVTSHGVALSWQGKGIGTALMEAALELADNWLGLTRVDLTLYSDNAAGATLYEKLGFEIEGTRVRYAFRNGEYVDAYSMARIR